MYQYGKLMKKLCFLRTVISTLSTTVLWDLSFWTMDLSDFDSYDLTFLTVRKSGRIYKDVWNLQIMKNVFDVMQVKTFSYWFHTPKMNRYFDPKAHWVKTALKSVQSFNVSKCKASYKLSENQNICSVQWNVISSDDI